MLVVGKEQTNKKGKVQTGKCKTMMQCLPFSKPQNACSGKREKQKGKSDDEIIHTPLLEKCIKINIS